jgi:hypothetical protein
MSPEENAAPILKIGKTQDQENLVDVSDHRLYYRVNGEGSPTVIIEGGIGASSEIYSLVGKASTSWENWSGCN